MPSTNRAQVSEALARQYIQENFISSQRYTTPMPPHVPSFWRSFFARQEARAEREPSFDEPVYRAKPGEVF
jgi:hypothetical protein